MDYELIIGVLFITMMGFVVGTLYRTKVRLKASENAIRDNRRAINEAIKGLNHNNKLLGEVAEVLDAISEDYLKGK